MSTPVSQVSPRLLADELGGRTLYSWQNLTQPPPRYLSQDVAHVQGTRTVQGKHGNISFITASAATIPRLMFKATNPANRAAATSAGGSTVGQPVPPKLQGVFWMKGNPSGNVLVVLQSGVWFQDQQTYLTPAMPYSLAWASRAPKQAPFWGLLHRAADDVMAILGDGLPSLTWSYVVRPCPEHRVCPARSTDGTYATLQLHLNGDLLVDSTNMHSLAPGLPSIFKYITGKFEMEEQIYSLQPGALWRRPCWWGIGSCRLLEVGSYELVKIIDDKGAPLQPGYDEFIDYLGDVPLYVWSGQT